MGENSPALQCWGSNRLKKGSPCSGRLNLPNQNQLQPSAFTDSILMIASDPTDESVDFLSIVRFATENLLIDLALKIFVVAALP